MAKLEQIEQSAIDLMDAYLQLLLALTWQRSRSDGLERLKALHRQVTKKLAQYPEIFSTEHKRFAATSQILNSLQNAQRRPMAAILQWTTLPINVGLPQLHRQIERQLFDAVSMLVWAAQVRVEANAMRHELTAWVETAIGLMAQDLGIPLHVPSLAGLILYLAHQPGRIRKSVLWKELLGYRKVAEQIAGDQNRMTRAQIITDLRSEAENISLQIDRSYRWDDLSGLANETSVSALGVYAQLNLHGLIKDAHFQEKKYHAPNKLSPGEFERHFSPFQIRGMTFMMTGDDLNTRRMRRRIVDSEHTDVRVNGRRVSNSLTLLIPYDDSEFDIERQLALLLLRLNRSRAARTNTPVNKGQVCEGAPSSINSSAPFVENLPLGLHRLIEDHGIRRKIVPTKKQMLFCLAGIMAENIYQYRDRNNTLLHNGKPLKTLEHAYEKTVSVSESPSVHNEFVLRILHTSITVRGAGDGKTVDPPRGGALLPTR